MKAYTNVTVTCLVCLDNVGYLKQKEEQESKQEQKQEQAGNTEKKPLMFMCGHGICDVCFGKLSA